jgi:hypothetical protein
LYTWCALDALMFPIRGMSFLTIGLALYLAVHFRARRRA